MKNKFRSVSIESSIEDKVWIMQQHLQGVILEYDFANHFPRKWVNSIKNPTFNFAKFVYRVKKRAPREFFINTRMDGLSQLFHHSATALLEANISAHVYESVAVKFKEVIDYDDD